MEMDTLVRIGTIAVAVLTLAYTVVSNRDKATAARVEKVETGLKDLEGRVTKAEAELEHVPGKDVVHRLEMSLARLEGQIEVLDERLKPVSAMASRLTEHALESAR